MPSITNYFNVRVTAIRAFILPAPGNAVTASVLVTRSVNEKDGDSSSHTTLHQSCKEGVPQSFLFLSLTDCFPPLDDPRSGESAFYASASAALGVAPGGGLPAGFAHSTQFAPYSLSYNGSTCQVCAITAMRGKPHLGTIGSGIVQSHACPEPFFFNAYQNTSS